VPRFRPTRGGANDRDRNTHRIKKTRNFYRDSTMIYYYDCDGEEIVNNPPSCKRQRSKKANKKGNVTEKNAQEPANQRITWRGGFIITFLLPS
jgi:hypothetical protein